MKKKLPYMNAIPFVVVVLVLSKLIFSANVSFAGLFEMLYSCIAYFVYGLAFAYFLNPFIMLIERFLCGKKDGLKAKRFKRGISIAAVYLIVVGFITIFIMNIGPAIVDGVNEFIVDLPKYINSTKLWLTDMIRGVNPYIADNIDAYLSEFAANIYRFLEQRVDVGEIGKTVTVTVSGSAKTLVRIGFGIMISVYFLYGKEELSKQVKRLIYALLKKETADTVIQRGRAINKVFRDFMVSKFIQAFVIFILGLVILIPFKVPLAVLISLLLAITNMIPYIGPWIGAIPSVLLAFLFDPIKGLIVLLFIVGMQIVDNLFIGPKIMSDTVGVSPLLVVAGVAIGGTFGGVLGMFIGVPIVAAAKLVFYDSFVERRLKEKEIEM